MEKISDLSTTGRSDLKGSAGLLPFMVRYAFLFFIIGLVVDLTLYIYNGLAALSILNTATVVLIAGIFALFLLKKTSADSAMLIILSAVTFNSALSIILLALNPAEDNSFEILMAMGVNFVPVLMARLTSRQYFSSIFIAVAMSCYIFADIYTRDGLLIYSTPILLLLLWGAGLLSSYIMKATRRVEREKVEAETEWNRLVRFLDLDKRQIDALKQGNLTKEDIANLMSNMTEAIRDLILQNAKTVVRDDHSMITALQQKHPALTAGELELCCMIAKGHSVGDISRMRGVGISTITSTRSRLRRKLSLPEGDSLRSYLESVIDESLP